METANKELEIILSHYKNESPDFIKEAWYNFNDNTFGPFKGIELKRKEELFSNYLMSYAETKLIFKYGNNNEDKIKEIKEDWQRHNNFLDVKLDLPVSKRVELFEKKYQN